MITHATTQHKDVTYDPTTEEFVWPITVHQLDGTAENTRLVISPDQFAVLAVQIQQAEDQRLRTPHEMTFKASLGLERGVAARCEDAVVLDEIDAVDWGSIPGHPDWFEPDRAARGLHALSEAANLVQAAEAGSQLGGGGIVHSHSAAVFPAAVVATPLLLDIVQRGHPAAKATALGLLDEALSCYPHAGYTRVVAPDGTAVPICCAIAHQLRARTDLLVGLGKRGKSLLADTAVHWRFVIRECVADGSDTAAFGLLAGCLPDGVHAAEMHLAGAITVLNELTLEYPPAEGSLEACLRVIARHPGDLPPDAMLFPAECGDRVH